MKCIRCDEEMKKEKVSMHLGYTEEKGFNRGCVYQEPINVNSIYICPNCGMIEFNIND